MLLCHQIAVVFINITRPGVAEVLQNFLLLFNSCLAVVCL